MKWSWRGKAHSRVKHLEAMANIPGVEVVSLAGGIADATRATAERFFAAIREGREPNSSVAPAFPAYQVLDHIQNSLL